MSVAASLWKALLEVDRFLRLHFVGFALVWCWLGAWSAVDGLQGATLAWVLGVALCFHNYAYVLNDVIDLPVDRTSPDRQGDPLVRGAISPATALAFCVAQVVAAFVMLWFADASALSYLALALGFALMTVYDVWGKRSPFPPATDLAQGLGWGSLAYVGAGLSSDAASPLTHVLFAYAAGHIFLINGIHGGIRDLDNDRRSGCLTTALYLGAHAESGQVRSTWQIVVFTMALQTGLIALLIGTASSNAFGYGPVMRPIMIVTTVLLSVALLTLAWRVSRPELPGWHWSMRIHLFLIPFALLALFLPAVGWQTACVIVLVYALPGATLDFTWELIGRLSGRADRATADGRPLT